MPSMGSHRVGHDWSNLAAAAAGCRLSCSSISHLNWHIHKLDQIQLQLFSVSQSVNQFSCSVMSNSLWSHGLKHTRPPCPLQTPRVYSDSCPLSQWCHPTISSSVIPFSSHLQSSPASGSFPMSQLSASGGQSIGVSASASVLPMNIQDWFPLGWTGWISLQSKGLKESSPTQQFNSINSSALIFLCTKESQTMYGFGTLKAIHDYWKNHSLD